METITEREVDKKKGIRINFFWLLGVGQGVFHDGWVTSLFEVWAFCVSLHTTAVHQLLLFSIEIIWWRFFTLYTFFHTAD
jgi:hypothetical protein